jgi:hypothetical protein
MVFVRKFIEKTLKEGKEAMKPPEPHMCVKTYIEVYFSLF